jgi:peptidoglycan/LPS O-acetylase OafA/YrhL
MLKKDNLWVGLSLAVILCIVSMGAIYLCLHLLNCSINDNAKLFLFAFVPDILLLRYYAKKQYSKATKGLILILVFGFCLLLYFLNFIGGLNFSS